MDGVTGWLGKHPAAHEWSWRGVGKGCHCGQVAVAGSARLCVPGRGALGTDASWRKAFGRGVIHREACQRVSCVSTCGHNACDLVGQTHGVASFVFLFSDVMEKCPKLRLCLAMQGPQCRLVGMPPRRRAIMCCEFHTWQKYCYTNVSGMLVRLCIEMCNYMEVYNEHDDCVDYILHHAIGCHV